MEKKETISQELMEIAPKLVSINRQMPYSLPEGYFDAFPIDMLSVVTPKKTGFSVPEDYFENLPAILLEKAKAASAAADPAEEAEQYTVLDAISKQMPYAVPVDYFEKFQVELPKQPARIVPLWPSLKRAAGWAVAASILALAGIFGYRYFSDNGTNEGITPSIATTENSFADSLLAAELADALSEVDEKNLKAELDGYGGGDKSAVHYYTTNNIEKALKGLSDEEIQKSLEAEGYIYLKS